eukprot:11574444-Alexandrium_andersonii.AAC.1
MFPTGSMSGANCRHMSYCMRSCSVRTCMWSYVNLGRTSATPQTLWASSERFRHMWCGGKPKASGRGHRNGFFLPELPCTSEKRSAGARATNQTEKQPSEPTRSMP